MATWKPYSAVYRADWEATAMRHAHKMCQQREAMIREQYPNSNYRCTDEDWQVFYDDFKARYVNDNVSID